ncbi:MAG TPA: hypothetical protein VFS67_35580 [Polyangiaceae bacterium]|nr:hypothetical protein [Polyangiaceae bacterium]
MTKPDLTQGTAVVTANRFNPSVLSQIWFVKNGITGENDFGPTSILSPEFVQIGTTNFNLFCTAEHLQFAPVGETSTWGKLTRETLGKILQTLPHTPFTAIGLNFIWRIRLNEGREGESLRQAFAGSSSVYRHFQEPNARFGAYLSKDYNGMRMRLTTLPTSKDGGESLSMTFNFHRALGEKPVEEMLGVLTKWDDALEYSRLLCDEVQGGIDK